MGKGKGQKAKVEEVAIETAVPAVPETGAEAPVQAEACPTYTLRADRRVDLLAMLLIRDVVPEEVVRAFEFYEEKHLR